MHLLRFFDVSNLLDVPWADDQTLEAFPLKQMWPTLAADAGSKGSQRLTRSSTASLLTSPSLGSPSPSRASRESRISRESLLMVAPRVPPSSPACSPFSKRRDTADDIE